LIIPVLFYLVIFGAGFDLDTLRRDGWLFEVARSEEKWYQFYTYFGASHLFPNIPFTYHA
jgi:SulP family sulfate permease